MIDDPQRFVVITGGPGSGKSSLIDALEREGFARSVEAGRAIIQDQLAIGGNALPWSDPQAFAELMLCWDLRSYHIACERHGPVFFDRGIPDIVGYLRLMQLPVPAYMDRASRMFRYNRRVYIAPPWPEIFEQDAERKQTLEEAEQTYQAMVETYSGYGYELVALPLAPVAERVGFILDRLGSRD
ncbi:AAA family ATPase [Rhodospirillaceae bacterium SYSU D60014]|uniref:AAA family ATPase n=1 Tax=Virgifigura deserti TaxID=2268457 RepID=UPI000E669BED